MAHESKFEEPIRQAEEVFVQMNRVFRVSRDIRAHWFFDHINNEVSINSNPKDTEKELSVIGILPKGGSAEEDVGDEKFLITEDTKIIYVSNNYRQVYVLDFSPSVVVADVETDSCLHNKLFESLRYSLGEVTKPFTLPGTKRLYSPKIFVSIIVFVPFLAFEEDLTLLNSHPLQTSDIKETLMEIENKYVALTQKLYRFASPVMQRWALLRRRHKSRLDSTCQNEPTGSNSDLSTGEPKRQPYEFNLPPAPRQMIPLPKSIFSLNKRIFDSETSTQKSKQVHAVEAREEGYIVPELALLFMLRLGLAVIQTMPENMQSNVIIVTDGVAGMAAPEALQTILRELRSSTVSCSFIELVGKSKLAPCFGHVTSGELFHFLSTSTFGGYMAIQKTMENLLGEDNCTYSTHEEDFLEPVNRFHRALLCWSFQSALQEDEHLAKAIRNINPTFAALYKIKRDYDVHFNTRYTTTLNELLCVRLREGFTLKRVSISEDRIRVLMVLPIRPGIYLEYTIDSPWPVSGRRELVDVVLVVSGPESEIRDLKIAKTTEPVYRANALRVSLISSLEEACRRVVLADKILLHMHSFTTTAAYYCLPPGAQGLPLCHYYEMKKSIIALEHRVLVPKFRPQGAEPFSQFLRFWKMVSELKQEEWQKWVHVHIERALLFCKPGGNVCIPQKNETRWNCALPREKLHASLMGMSSFCLIKEELYVVFVTRSTETVPGFFYLIRVEEIIPHVTFKIAFLGGICGTERRSIVNEVKKTLNLLTFYPNGSHQHQRVLSFVKRPLERIIVQYDKLPKSVYLAQWTIGKEDVPLEKPLRVENERHNTITKYLDGRRHMWRIPMAVLEEEDEGNHKLAKRIAEVTVNALLHKRFNEGYKVAWTKNLIIGLCRQVEVQSETIMEQYILFPPTFKPYLENQRLKDEPLSFTVVAEYWREPCAFDKNKEQLVARARLDDELIVCLFTVDHLVGLCAERICVSGQLNTSAVKGRNERMITSRVSCVDHPFNIHTLLKHSRRLLLHLPIFEVADDPNWEIRNPIFSNAFFDELGNYSNVFMDIQDQTAFARIFSQLLVDKEETSKVDMKQFEERGYDERYLSRCRIFVKVISQFATTVIVAPAANVFPENGRSWPLVMSVCEESSTTYSIIRNSPRNRVLEYSLPRVPVGRQEWEDFPTEFDLNDSDMYRWVCERDVHVRRATYRQIKMKPLVQELQEAILQKATVSALFKLLKTGHGGVVDKEDVSFILDEICDYTNVELQGIPPFIDSFCDHLNPNDPRKDDSLCDVSNFQSIFEDTLKENNFHPVPRNPIYFFHKPKHGLVRRFSYTSEGDKVGVYPGGTEGDPIHQLLCRGAPIRHLLPQDCPLFCFFHCVLRLPNGEEEYIAVDYIPSCVNQVLRTAGKEVDPEALKNVRIKLLLYVLTWPRTSMDEEEDDSIEIDDTNFAGRSKKFLKRLPAQEREVLRNTLNCMNRFLELECLLAAGKGQQVTVQHLQRVSRFITQTVGKNYCDILEMNEEDRKKRNFLAKRIRQRYRTLKFVVPSQTAFQTLMERLDKKLIAYCVLRKVEGANMFYIRRMENKRTYEQYLRDSLNKKEGRRPRQDSTGSPRHLLSRTESEISILSTSGGNAPGDMEKMINSNSENSTTFWVVLSIEKNLNVVGDEEILMKLQFCERYAAEPSHSKIYSATWNEMRAETRKINQEILLEEMFYTRKCSAFLLTKEEKDPSDRRTISEMTDEDDDGQMDLSRAHTSHYDFAPGSLACPLVWEKWIEIHPRLRRKNEKNGVLHEAAVTLRMSLEQYMVLNVPNTFVFRSEDGYILYGQIYSTFDQFQKSGKKFKLHDFDKIKEKVRLKFGGNDKDGKSATSLLFVGFGVARPPESMTKLLSETLIDKKLSEQVLDTLVDIYRKNPRAMLESYDVEFIQPDPRKPSAVYNFTIPAVMKKFTSAVRLYYLQHMSQFHMEEAHAKNRPFHSYPPVLIPGKQSNPNYYPQFHLHNIFKKEGRSHNGIAVIELRIMTGEGLIDKLYDGVIRQDSYNSLLPSSEERNMPLNDWFEEATTTYCEVVEDPCLEETEYPKPPKPVENACGYIQAIVWQVGDVGLSQLQQILTDVVEGAFLDVVTEYGVLNSDVTEATSILQPPCSPSASITPTKVKTPNSATKLSASRKRDSTEGHSASANIPTPAFNSDKRGSGIFTYDHGSRRGSNHDLPITRDDFVLPPMRIPEHLSSTFKQNIENWFEYIQVRRNNQRDDYQKHIYDLRHSVLVPQTLNQIEQVVRKLLANKIDRQLSDKVQLFHNANRGTSEEPRYDLVTAPLKDENASDLPPNDVHPRYVLTGYCEEVHCNTRRYGYEIAKNPQDAPTVLVKLADQNKDCKWLFLPTLEETFIPRQTFLLLQEHNNKIILYAYNLLPQTYYEVADMIVRIVMWQNAKYRLYEHIIDNPLDPVLPPVEEDERTVSNPYTQIIGADPDILIAEQAPPDDFESITTVPISQEVASRLFRVRRTYTAQVPQACRFQRTFQKFKEMRKEVKQQVLDYQSNKVMYDELSQGETEVSEHKLTTMWGHSRRVHYVQTPVLLSPAWRRKIAQVRRGTMEDLAKPKPPTPSGITTSGRSRAPTSTSLSLNRQITFSTKTKSEDDELYDPCHVKMLHDLTGEYVNYLKTLGLNLLTVSNASDQGTASHRYKRPPDVCLFRQLVHGVILLRLHFVPPYFIMSVGMWAAPELLLRDQQLTERESKKFLCDLEIAKDLVVAKCHIHSFTYDFHLRMISRYLIHKEVLFPTGYNTSTFLTDFLKYYACRPPSARNCVYEERPSFYLHRNVNSTKVWECFLEKNYEEKYRWKILRIRITDEETDPSNARANEYMLVSCADDTPEEEDHVKICVLLRDRRRKETDGSISLAQYMILISQERNNPLEEARQREDSSKSNVGEFRSVNLPTEEQVNREVDDMMALLMEGGMPTVEGKYQRRRRFNSGGHTPPLQIQTSGETDSSLHSPVGLHGSESDVNVPVQGDPTLRHRKTAESSEEGEIPTEKANYVQYISVGQRKLQELLETTTLEYSHIIKEAVEYANRECLREFLWNSVHTLPSPLPVLPKLGSQVRLGNSMEVWHSLKCLTYDSGQHITELFQLVDVENMADRDARLGELLDNTNCARLCRFLAYRFGVRMCRLFETATLNPKPGPLLPNRRNDPSPDTTPGNIIRHLILIDPDNPVVFIVRCEDEKSPSLFVLFKKPVSQLNDHFASLLDKSFDLIVQAIGAFLWSDLIYRPPGKS